MIDIYESDNDYNDNDSYYNFNDQVMMIMMIRERGEEEVESLMESFRTECAGLLGVGRGEVGEVKMTLRTRYWITLYQK